MNTALPAVLTMGIVAACPLAAQVVGPNSSRDPYVIPTSADAMTVALISGGDAVDGYRLVGIPDGAGAYDNGDETFTLFVHHELVNTVGITRAHGGVGAFISEWVIAKPGHAAGDFAVLSGRDTIQSVWVWNAGSDEYQPSLHQQFSRFCSADLAAETAFFRSPWRGTTDRIFLGGEEVDGTFTGAPYGRAFATVVTGSEKGTTYELPLMGDMSFENVVASPHEQNKTIVASLDDSASDTTDSLGEVYFYLGKKQRDGNAIEKAGLTNGELYGLVIKDLPIEDAANGMGNGAGATGRFRLAALVDLSDDDGHGLFDMTRAGNELGITKFLRPEDGHWDPTNPEVFYFVTTGASYDSDGDGNPDTTGPGRLWKLTFHDIRQPKRGGTIELVLDGTEGVVTPDNITVNRNGDVYIQEDPGTNDRLAKVWHYAASSGTLTEIAAHDAYFFLPGGGLFITTNEESSGIIDLSDILGAGWYFADVQSHISLDDPGDGANRALFGYDEATGDELVEDGQLVLIYNGAESQ